MHKGVDLPFEMTSELSLEPDGRIRAHPRKMKMLGVNGAALLHALGMHLDKVLDVSGSRGATVQGDDLLLDPVKIIPPPAIEGKLSSVRVEGDHVTQTFGRTADDSVFGTRVVVADTTAHHYLYFRGGQLRFGKLLMTDTDLLIVDADQSDPFDLYMARYNVQLTAGTDEEPGESRAPGVDAGLRQGRRERESGGLAGQAWAALIPSCFRRDWSLPFDVEFAF